MNKALINKYRYLDLILFILATVFIISPLLQQGLFIDGLLYKTVSNNFYTNDGTFWKMKFSDVSMNPFYEQPPFYFALTGTFYKLCGNSYLVDKFFTLLLVLISVYLIKKISSKIFKNELIVRSVIFFLLCIPVLSWAYTNQVIETLVLPMSLMAFYFFLKYMDNTKVLNDLFYISLYVLMVFLLFLTKGFQSCFIAISPFLYALFFKSKRSFIFASISSLMLLVLFYYTLFVNESSAEWFSNYMQKRLMASLNGVGATTTYRAEIIIRTFTELIVPILVVLIIFLAVRKKNIQLPKSLQDKNRMAWMFLFIAFSGSIPFAITFEQRGFYLVPSFPFFILAFTTFFNEQLNYSFEKLNEYLTGKTVKAIVIVSMILSVVYCFYSPFLYKRDENLINDLRLISPYLRSHDTIAIDSDTWNDTALQAYLYMQGKVNVECNYTHQYYIHDRNHLTTSNNAYTKVDIPTKQYDLFIKK